MLPRPSTPPAGPSGPALSMSQVGAQAAAGGPPSPGGPAPPGGQAGGGSFSPQDLQKLSQVLTPDVVPLVLKIAGAGMIDAFQSVLQHLSQQGGAAPGGPAAAAPASPAQGSPPNMPTGASGQPLQ